MMTGPPHARPCLMGEDMRYALSAEQMRSVEERVVAEGLAPFGELMERAGAAAADEVHRRIPEGAVAVVAGPGNNGGDGWVAARLLHKAGRACRVVSLVSPETLRGEALEAAHAAIEAGVEWVAADHTPDVLASAAVIVDAVFGFGFRGQPEARYASVLAEMAASPAFVIAVDVPSGVHAATGLAPGVAVRADVTVTFTAVKPGLLIHPGAEHAGEVVVADIGIPTAWTALSGALEVPVADDLVAAFPWPQPQDHKGSRGRVAIVAGSATYPGAAVLALQGALRLGPGFAVVVVPEPIADIVRASAPNALVRAVPADETGSIRDVGAVLGALEDADAVVAGPGLTQGGAIPSLVERLIAEVRVPLLLDADALNALEGGLGALGVRSAATLLTPHPGEAARLLGVTSEDVQADRVASARSLCAHGSACLLKGARTIVAWGGRTSVITAGNPGLARAGSGDVLAGMLGALLAQGVPAYEAAVLGSYLHGRAADYGVRELTVTCFTSADIARFLPDAVRELTGE